MMKRIKVIHHQTGRKGMEGGVVMDWVVFQFRASYFPLPGQENSGLP